MKKPDYKAIEALRKKRERKRLKRLDVVYHGSYIFKGPSQDLINLRLRSCFTKTYHHLNGNGFHDDSLIIDTIEAPAILSFKQNFKDSFIFIKSVFSSIYIKETIKISFEKCNVIDISTLLLIQLIVRDYYTYIQNYNKRFSDEYPNCKIVYNKSSDFLVNRMLYALGFIPRFSLSTENNLLAVSSIGFLVGSKQRKHYHESLKGVFCTRIRNYINHCMNGVEFELSEEGHSYIDGLISEILNNSEDHSLIDDWFVTGASFHEKGDSPNDIIAEFNLVIMNLGFSIYEGFEQTKEENYKVYNLMQQQYDKACSTFKSLLYNSYDKENMFTLYALQEGISRIKYLKESRGNGTMNFIRAFIELGSYENSNRNYKPSLSILSGKTLLICDNTYKPYLKDDLYLLSLNPENDIDKLPDKNYLKKLPSSFPGTLLEIKIYLNNEHFLKKLNGNSNN